MERRALLKMIALATGGILIGGDALLLGCTAPAANTATIGLFSREDQDFLDEVAETILPATGTPGAKAAHLGVFIAMMATDCYPAADRKILWEGIALLDKAAAQVQGAGFLKLTAAQRHDLLFALDETVSKKGEKHYFTMMKQLTLLGYFTSEIGCTQALRYTPVPGKYKGSVPYRKGDKAWA